MSIQGKRTDDYSLGRLLRICVGCNVGAIMGMLTLYFLGDKLRFTYITFRSDVSFILSYMIGQGTVLLVFLLAYLFAVWRKRLKKK